MAKDSIASWTTLDEVKLLNFLTEHASAAGDGGNFKATTFEVASAVLDQIPVKGIIKTWNACSNKYSSVSCPCLISGNWLTLYLQLRRIFRAIQAIKNRSGWTWSNETGASITPDMENVWGDFLKIYREAKPFENHGWIHLEKMIIIMPASLKGYHVFHPLQGLSGIGSLSDDNEDIPPYAANTQEEDETANDEGAHPTAAVSFFCCFDHQCLYF